MRGIDSLSPPVRKAFRLLESLPAGSVVRDCDGYTWRSVGPGWGGAGKSSAYWHLVGHDHELHSPWELAFLQPITRCETAP